MNLTASFEAQIFILLLIGKHETMPIKKEFRLSEKLENNTVLSKALYNLEYISFSFKTYILLESCVSIQIGK